jgi:hypothetical protein
MPGGPHARGRFVPFAGKPYELRWGTTARRGTTTEAGYVDESGLDGVARAGLLQLGAVHGSRFQPEITITVQDIDRVPHAENHPAYYRLSNLGFPVSVLAPVGPNRMLGERYAAVALYRNSRGLFDSSYGEDDRAGGVMGAPSHRLIAALIDEHDDVEGGT